jgi:large subunit ribosomal protein L25
MKLAAQTRTVFGKKVAALRKEGQVPGEVYGHGTENLHVAVSARDLAKALKEVGHTGIIMLGVEGKERRVLAHDWTVDTHTGEIAHVDFHAVKAGEKIKAAIAILFEGEAPAVKDGLGTLVKNLHEIEVEGLPEKIPHEAVVDLEGLAELGASVHAKDIKLPAGVELLTAEDTVVASIAEVTPEEEPQADMTVEDVAVEGEKEEDSDESAEAS